MSEGFDRTRLQDTITTRWRRQLAGVRPDQKRHWRTKVLYYKAVVGLLDAGDDAPSWRSIVEAVEPRGHRSTFYEVAGPNAKHPLVGAFTSGVFTSGEEVEAMQLALCFRRTNAVHQLIDEAKVWSYWPYREGLLAQLRIATALDTPTTVGLLIGSLTSWVRHCPHLGAAIDYAPPLCAVEDLLLIRPGQLSAHNAYAVLSDAMKNADGPERSLSVSGPPTTSGSATLLEGLARQIDAIDDESRRAAPPEAEALRRRAANLMLDAALALI